MGKVYLIGNENNQYKIGMTRGNVNERIEQLQVGNALTLEFIAEFETKHFRKVEKWMHKRHHSKRMEGEWFSLNEEDIANFSNDCQKSHDMFEVLINAGNPFI